MKQNDAASLLTRRVATINATNGYNNGKGDLRREQVALQATVKSTVLFATMVRDVLKPVFGRTHNTAWAEAGFSSSLEIPASGEGVATRLESMKSWLAAHPERNSEDLGITAQEIEKVIATLRTAIAARNEKRAMVGALLKERRAKTRELQLALSGLARELKQLMPNDDPRWAQFGLRIPASVETPEAPTNLVAVLVGETAISLKWDAGVRATHYRVWYRVVGGDEKFQWAGSPADLDFTIEGLPSNGIIEVAVSSVNRGGESAKTEPVKVRTDAVV